MTKHIHITAYGFHFQLYATIHNDHSEHLFPFVQKQKIENWKSFSAYHDKQKVNPHTHTQLSKTEANWAVELCISAQRVVYGTQP